MNEQSFLFKLDNSEVLPLDRSDIKFYHKSTKDSTKPISVFMRGCISNTFNRAWKIESHHLKKINIEIVNRLCKKINNKQHIYICSDDDSVLMVDPLDQKNQFICYLTSVAGLMQYANIYTRLLDNVPTNIWWIDEVGTVYYRNKYMMNLEDEWGGFSNSLIGRSTNVYDEIIRLFGENSDHFENIIMNDRSVIENKKQITFEEYVDSQSDNDRYMLSQKKFFAGGVLGTSVDISQYKTTENDLINARQRQLKEVETLQSVIEEMRHDFKSPLSNIITISEYIRHSNDKQEKNELLNSVNHCCYQLLNMIDSFADDSKYKSIGSVSLDKVYIHDFCEKLKSYATIMIIDTKLSFDLKLSDSAPDIFYTDHTRIERIVNNLVANAVKFTQEGYITIVINFGYDTKKESHMLNIIIADTGIGIDEKDVPHVFNKHFRHSNSHGYGLGLSIVKSYINDLNGHITVASKIDIGTQFNLSIPIVIHDT